MKTVTKLIICGYCLLQNLLWVSQALQPSKDEVDKVIEDEITLKLGADLVQSIEMKFHSDLQKSVDSVLLKIKLLLQNGTNHIQTKLTDLEAQLDEMKKEHQKEVTTCLNKYEKQTTVLAEKALHQMVVCGYALIGHDPAEAVRSVMMIKDMIRKGMAPINEQKNEVNTLLKVCGHDHDSLKKVIKCVISKSPIIKTSMMDITGKLLSGVVELTKQMAHGAMHEACLIEVVKTVEDEAFLILKNVKNCVFRNNTIIAEEEMEKYLKENNATVLDLETKEKPKINLNTTEVKEMKSLIRRMLSGKSQELDKKFKKKLEKLQKELGPVDDNVISNDLVHKD